MKNKRGQAAMEFLMTYGWAILAAVIVVGVLWYMIGNPADLAGSQFQIGAPLVGNAMVLTSTGVQVEVRNGLADQITIANVTIDVGGTCNNWTNAAGTLAAGALGSYTILCDLSSVERFNGDIVFHYTKTGSTLTQQVAGSISGKVA